VLNRPRRRRINAYHPFRYTDIRKAGRHHVSSGFHRKTGEKYYLETMGTGVAWIDYDQDGLMDLYFVQSAATDILQTSRAVLRSALYHKQR